MKIRCIIGWATFAASLACSGAWAWDQDPAAQYFERKDTIVSGAGDARDVNAATHIIDPWPRYVGNRRIPGNGQRMTGAVERYRTNTPWPTPCPITPTFDIQTEGIRCSDGEGLRQSVARHGRDRRCAGGHRGRHRAAVSPISSLRVVALAQPSWIQGFPSAPENHGDHAGGYCRIASALGGFCDGFLRCLRDKRLELFPGQGAALDQGIGDNRDKRPLRFKDIRGAKFQPPIDSPFRDPQQRLFGGMAGARTTNRFASLFRYWLARHSTAWRTSRSRITAVYSSFSSAASISASDYKRLVRRGGADWVSIQGAPQEILDIISRTSRTDLVRGEQIRPAIVAFVPSAGGSATPR